MFIYGKLVQIQQQLLDADISPLVIAYLNGLRKTAEKKRLLLLQKPHEVKIQGREIYASESAFITAPREKKSYESHRKYIDIHYVLGGKETIEWSDVHELSVTQGYNQEKDYTLYDGKKKGNELCMKPGMVAVFFPEDGHMPGICAGKPVRVVKVVVKLAI